MVDVGPSTQDFFILCINSSAELTTFSSIALSPV